MNQPVIVIEDDRDILDIMKYIIEDAKHDVIGFDELPDISTIAAINPFLILLDERLQAGYGSVLCTSLKSNERTNHIPVVLISAVPNLETIARKCQADGFLPKPFDLEQLTQLVTKFLPSILRRGNVE